MNLLMLMPVKYSAKVLSGVPKCKEDVTCLMEKIHVLDKFCSGIRYSAVGCEFSVNESTM